MRVDAFIPLLSGKPLSAFTPEEFRQYVRSLNKPRVKKVSRTKKKPLKVRLTRLKKGALSFTTRRKPAYITRAEYEEFCQNFPANEVFVELKSKGVLIYLDHKEASESIKTTTGEITWK
jgi:hypothetical protein